MSDGGTSVFEPLDEKPILDLLIRKLAPDDELAWRRLWGAYNDFYRADVDATVTERLWQRLLSEKHPHLGLAATVAGNLAGFAHVIPHPVTWATGEAAYLEDLFVCASERKRGIGHALIERVLEVAQASRWSRVYWDTKADNFTARRLYDRFTPADDIVRYRISLD